MRHVNITPLLATKENWPDNWCAWLTDDNRDCMTVVVTPWYADQVPLGRIRVFHQSESCQVDKFNDDDSETDLGNVADFDAAIASLKSALVA